MGGLFFSDSLTIDAFQCIECKAILKPPIIITSIGNMCLHHEKQKGETSSYEVEPRLRNIPLEQIMEHITCACRYKERGCEVIVKLHEISEHEQSCKFKTFPCLLAGCEWAGVESGYVSHLYEHTDYIDRGSDGMFQLECNTEGTDDVRILRTISGLSLLHVKVLKDKLICAVYDIENRYTESYKIWITSVTSERSKIHSEHLCQIVDSWYLFLNFEPVDGTEIQFEILNPVENRNVTVCLEHVFKGEIVSSKLKDKSKYKGCLKLLEEMQVRLPCGNASLGCREQHFSESQHENTSCHYKSWKCPTTKNICKFQGLFTDLVNHIENNHDSIRQNETTVTLNLSFYEIAFIVYGNVFILEYTNSKSTYSSYDSSYYYNWQVLQLTNRFDSSPNFGVEITLNSSDGRKSFYLKDGFKKNELNENRCEMPIEMSASKLSALVPQCTEARVRITEMKDE